MTRGSRVLRLYSFVRLRNKSRLYCRIRRVINCYTNSEIYGLRSNRPLYHLVQVSFSASITLELGFRRWRMKDSRLENFSRPFSNALPQWAPSRFLWNQHIQNSSETDVGKLRNTYWHTTGNLGPGVRTVSPTQSCLSIHFRGGFSLWQIPILREAFLTNSRSFAR